MANRKRLFDLVFTAEGAHCATAEETAALGGDAARDAGVGGVISLEGPLGAGKTQFARGFAHALCGDSAASSPTFALLHEYTGGPIPLFHFDFYRMTDDRELLTAGYDDCLEEGMTLVEWGDKFPEVLPSGAVRLHFEIQPDGSRRIRGFRLP